MSEVVAYAARPTLRIDQEPNTIARSLLVSAHVQEQEGGLSSMELRMTNYASEFGGEADFPFASDSVVTFGTNIAVYMGSEDEGRAVFEGVVTGLEAVNEDGNNPELIILGEDSLQAARLMRRTKVYEEMSIADIADEIASNLGLQANVTGLTDSIGVQVQLNESDIAFLRRILARYDGDVQIVNEELQVSGRQDVRRGEVTLTLNENLKSARVLADLAHQVTEVVISGWDAIGGTEIEGSGSGTPPGPGQGTSGSDVVARVFNERIHRVSHIAVTTQEEADAVAQAAYEQRARQFMRIIATAEGDPEIRVGTHVTVEGLEPRFNNVYYVTQATHRWDEERGYETDLEAICGYWGGQ